MKWIFLASLLAVSLSPAQDTPGLETRLATIRLQEILFHEIRLDEFVDELRGVGSRAGGLQPSASALNFVLIAESKESFSMPARDLSLLELLHLGCRSFRVKAIFDPQAVVIVPLDHRFINPATTEQAASGQEAIWRKRIKPTVQFEHATIEEACEYLITSTRSACDPPLDLPPLNVVLKSTPSASAKKLSIFLHNVSVHDALRYFGELSGLKLRYQAEAAVLSPAGYDWDQIEIRGTGTAKARADRITLPTVEFMGAALSDVVAFVQTKSAEVDPSKKGVKIKVPAGLVEKAPCTLSLRRMSVSEVLRYAAGLMELKLITDDEGFNLTER